ncbi:hypothetical protein PIB30_055473 [Stylosanthes scabra]|uniref:Uncharacterized protein n=1 Tax=Stylosanthes scabra TaxID=79078 RepID=A0ABU6RJG1_9FABA|nr:hypothetical protein [Stylosanthes scabra]
MATPTKVPSATVVLSSENDATSNGATDSISSFTADSQAMKSSDGKASPCTNLGILNEAAKKVAGSRREMRRRMRGFHRELSDIRSFMQKQDKINTDSTLGPVNSPIVDSSSPAAVQSGAKVASPSVPKGNPGRPPLKTYKRRRVTHKSDWKRDCVFYFTRSNNRKGKLSLSKGSCSAKKGKRALFATHNKAVCIPPLEKDYVSSSSHRCWMYMESQNFLQVHRPDTSRWASEIGSDVPAGMPLTFTPTDDMQIVGLDLAAAAYVFKPQGDQERVSDTLFLSFGAVPTPRRGVWRLGIKTGCLAIADGRLGVILGADSGLPGCDSVRRALILGVQLFCCNFPRVVSGSNQLSTIDIYIPNRSPGCKLSKAIGIR